MQFPEFSKPFKLTTDASNFAVSAILTQEKQGVDLPIAYFSKVLNECEQRYDEAERECLAVLYAVESFRPYLYGREFTLACDFEPVHWMTSVINPGARLSRWRLRLRDYSYKFEYKKGKLNSRIKALSENPPQIDKIEEDSSSTLSESSDDSDAQLNINSTKPQSVTFQKAFPIKKLPIQNKKKKTSSTIPTRMTASIMPKPVSILKRPSLLLKRTKSNSDGTSSELKPKLSFSTTTKQTTKENKKQPLIDKNLKIDQPVASTSGEDTISSRLKLRKLQLEKKDSSENEQFSSTDESSIAESEESDPPVFRSTRSTLPSLGFSKKILLKPLTRIFHQQVILFKKLTFISRIPVQG